MDVILKIFLLPVSLIRVFILAVLLTVGILAIPFQYIFKKIKFTKYFVFTDWVFENTKVLKQ